MDLIESIKRGMQELLTSLGQLPRRTLGTRTTPTPHGAAAEAGTAAPYVNGKAGPESCGVWAGRNFSAWGHRSGTNATPAAANFSIRQSDSAGLR